MIGNKLNLSKEEQEEFDNYLNDMNDPYAFENYCGACDFFYSTECPHLNEVTTEIIASIGNDKGRTVALRCDMDGLKITENTGCLMLQFMKVLCMPVVMMHIWLPL